MSVSLSELVHYCTLKVREEEIREQQLRDLAVKAWKLPFVAVVQWCSAGHACSLLNCCLSSFGGEATVCRAGISVDSPGGGQGHLYKAGA